MGTVVVTLLGWAAWAYLLWRAWPAVRADLGVVRRRLPFRFERGRYSGGRAGGRL